MVRAAGSAFGTILLTLAGCGTKNEPPIGYTPETERETESVARESGSGRTEPPPTGGAGYEFGITGEKVREKCVAGGGKFKQAGDVSSCTKRYDDAGAMQVTLVEYCNASVCRIHSVAVLDHPDAKTWLDALQSLQRGLQKSFGKPDDQKVEVPSECEKRFADCVKNGKASATLLWHWPDGSTVMLRLGSIKKLPGGVSVSYANSAGATTGAR